MLDLSIGTILAWKIAAIEAKLSQYQYIEKEHILIGICSLEKIFMTNSMKYRLKIKEIQELKQEYDMIEKLLVRFKINSTDLRRFIRKNLRKGNYKHSERVIHRSENCRNIFKHAEEIALDSDKILCLHLIAAIMEKPTGILASIIEEKMINVREIKYKALLLAKSFKKENNNSYII